MEGRVNGEFRIQKNAADPGIKATYLYCINCYKTMSMSTK